MSSFAKPENALQRANELVAVGQSATALQTLHDVITAKRHRTWQQTMESIMLRYVELCVELQKGKMAKDGLIQYRMSCQHVNIASLEVVIEHLLHKAEEALAVAKEAAGIEFLPDDDVSPESLVAALTAGSASSSDKDQVEKVLPWMKFLWEAYRTVLEILRNNAKLEAVYQATAQRALQYCLKYTRTSEFKRLCDILRSHLANLNKFSAQSHQQSNISLTNAETVHYMIETRFVQLDVACQLELWQEAFRSIEDIHSLMQITRKPLKGTMVRQYFDRLATIFWASENHLLHAHALHKLFDKASSLKASDEELSAMASQLLLATLCVPSHENKKASAQYYDFDVDRDRGLRLSSLLGLTTSLDCNLLLNELVARGVPTIVAPEVSDLHNLLLAELDPLQMCEKAKPLLARLQETYPQYIPALKKTICVQLLGQLGEVYTAMQMGALQKLAAGIVNMQEMEKLIVEAVRNNHIQVRLDFQTNTVRFGDDGVEYDDIRYQINTLSNNLKQAMSLMHPEEQEKEDQRKKREIGMLANELNQEHERVLARKAEIEERKEQYEKDLHRKEKLEQLKQKEKEEKEAIKERARLDKEAERREEARKVKEEEDQAKRERAEHAKKIAAMGGTDKSLQELEALTAEGLEAEQRKSMNKQREEREHKLSIAARRLDYIERARRILERPSLLEAIDAKKGIDEQFWNQHQTNKANKHRADWEEAVTTKAALLPMEADTQAYQAQLSEVRKKAYASLCEQRKIEWESNAVRLAEERRANRREEKIRQKEQIRKREQAAADRAEREAREAEDLTRYEKDRMARDSDRHEREGAANNQAEVQRRREEEVSSRQQSEGSGASRWGGDRGGGDEERGGRWGGARDVPQGNDARGGFGGDAPARGGWGGDRAPAEERPRWGGAPRTEGGAEEGRAMGGGGWRERSGADRAPQQSSFGGDRGGGDSRFGGGSSFGGDRREGGSSFGGDRGGGDSRFGSREGGSSFGGDRGGGDRFGARDGGRDGGRDAGGSRWGGERAGAGGDGGGRWGRDAPREEAPRDAPPRRSEGGWQPRSREGGAGSSGGASEGGGWRTAK